MNDKTIINKQIQNLVQTHNNVNYNIIVGSC